MPSTYSRGHAEPEARDLLAEALREVGDGPVHRGRVVGVMARDGLEHRRRVLHVLGQRPDLVERAAERDEPEAAHQPVGRLDPDDAAEGGRLPDAPSGVGAERVEGLAGGDGGGGAARAASRHPVERPRVARGVEGRVLRRRPHGELVHVALAEQHRARFLQTQGHRRVVGRDEALQHPRRAGRRHAFGHDVVLELHRRAGQGTGLAGGDARVGGLGVGEGAVAGDGDVRLDAGLDGGDAVEVRLRQLDRGDLAAAQQVRRLVGRQGIKLHRRATLPGRP